MNIEVDEWKAGEPCYVDPDGRRWLPFAVQWEADNRVFAFEVWAISHEHAVLMLSDLISTARIAGRVVHRMES